MKFVSRTTPYPPLDAGARPKITGPVLLVFMDGVENKDSMK